MKKVFTLLLVFLCFTGFAQIMGDGEVYLTGERTDPSFNGGGLPQFYKYLNTVYDFSKPTKAGKMVTSITITETGEVKNIKVVEFVDMESAAEMIRVLKNAPKWKPAMRHGKAISVDIKFPFNIRFKEQDEPDRSETAQQEESKKEVAKGPNDILAANTVEYKPEYPGGMAEFHRMIMNNFMQPEDKNFKGGRVIASFVIEKDGSLTEITIKKDAGFGTGEELVRVLQKSKKWKPAMQNDKPVRCSYVIPVNLRSN